MGNNDFTIKDTNIMKGFAIIFMIFHHLFYTKTDAFPIINEISITNTIGLFCKVCVGVFVFLSGYGISATYNKEKSLLSFYKKRLLKLYLNYWLIWLLFVPITIIVFHGSFRYGNHFYIKLFLDLLGLNAFWGFNSINGNFWFIGVIAALYLIYPILRIYIEKFGLLGLLPTFIIIYLKPFSIGAFSLDVLRPWVFCFSLGIYFNNKKSFERIKTSFDDLSGTSKHLISSFTILLFSYFRDHNYLWSGINFDGIWAMAFCTSVFLITPKENSSNCKTIFSFFELLGKHSMNIYLFHTFILIYWFDEIFYSGNILMFIPAVLTCLVLSFVLEVVKKIVGFNYLQNTIINGFQNRE